MSDRVHVIIGGGHAGAAAIGAMRSAGFAGRIVLISAEPHKPYERPPLSKEVLVSPGTARLPIFPDDHYETHGVELRLGATVTDISSGTKTLTLEGGETLHYDKLLLATGARPRRYPLLDALGAGVHVLRTLEDGLALQKAFVPGRQLLVVGGGIIGLEVAASAATLDLSVTVLERGARLMNRGVPAPLVETLSALHKANGVRFELNVEITHASRDPSGRFHLHVADGRAFSGDVILYGVGIELNDELARKAGLVVDNGVLVDMHCRTSDPDIFAAGDIALQFMPHFGTKIRQETWANAVHQGAAAGVAMVTGETSAFELPWYWTDQYSNNFQVAGAFEADEWLTRGDAATGKYTLLGLTGGTLTGAVTVNNGREMRPLRQLIAAGTSFDPAQLADPATDLRKLRPAA